MNTFSLAIKGLQHKPLHTILSTLAISMGIAMLTSVFLISTGLSDGLKRNNAGIDIVAGAKGSPLQLILSTIYHTDVPIGNIDMSDFEKIRQNSMVKKAIPIVIGDHFEGARIVGTTPDFLDLYQAKFEEGGIFLKPFDIVAGAKTTVKTGQEFAAHHGFTSDDAAHDGDIHDDHLYKVVGRLAPTGTVLDRLLITPYASVQELHAHHDHDEEEGELHSSENHDKTEQKITAILIKARNHASVMNLPRMINNTEQVQAANPQYELTRLSKTLGIGRDVLNALAASVLGLSLLMLFATLASSLTERRHDMAVLRVLGASPTKLFTTLMTEGVLLGAIGSLIGIVFGHILAYSLSQILGSFEGIILRNDLLSIHPFDIVLFAIGCGAGILGALPAAISAARTDIAKLLVKS